VSSLTGIIDAFSNEIDVAKIILIGNQGIYVHDGSFRLDYNPNNFCHHYL
jgi:hypothetical protein